MVVIEVPRATHGPAVKIQTVDPLAFTFKCKAPLRTFAPKTFSAEKLSTKTLTTFVPLVVVVVALVAFPPFVAVGFPLSRRHHLFMIAHWGFVGGNAGEEK